MDKVQVFKQELEHIQTIPVHQFAVEAIKKLPDYFFEVAASSTGKYHPQYALGFGGLVRHTKAAVKVAIQMLELEQYKNAFSDEERDLMILALILHDGMKHGLNGSKYTVADHPIVMAEFIKNDSELKDMLTQEQIDFLTDCIASHMGEWTTDYRTKKEILPKPETAAQQLVHLCDWLASRKWLNIDFEDDVYTGPVVDKKPEELVQKIDEIIAVCKQAVADGHDRQGLYDVITEIIGSNNPRKIQTMEDATKVLSKVQARIALMKL